MSKIVNSGNRMAQSLISFGNTETLRCRGLTSTAPFRTCFALDERGSHTIVSYVCAGVHGSQGKVLVDGTIYNLRGPLARNCRSSVCTFSST